MRTIYRQAYTDTLYSNGTDMERVVCEIELKDLTLKEGCWVVRDAALAGECDPYWRQLGFELTNLEIGDNSIKCIAIIDTLVENIDSVTRAVAEFEQNIKRHYLEAIK